MHVMKQFLRSSIIYGLLLQVPWARAAKQYTGDALYKDDIGLDGVKGLPAAFADFNSDKYADIFVLSGDQRTLTVYLWQPETARFEPSTAIITLPASDVNGFVIENVIPGDFNYDGTLDVLVMGRKEVPKEDNGQGELLMRVYLGNGRDHFDSNYITVPSSTAIQPIPFDFVGDMRIHLLGYPSTNADTLSVWKNRPIPVGQNTTELFDIVKMPQSDKFCKLAHPHSGAFIDLNGDCLADLFVTCEDKSTDSPTYQIWINHKSDGFQLARNGTLPKGAGPVSFADIDGDGSMDMVVPSCNDKQENCYIHILYNQQERLCGYDDQTVSCRPLDALCRADNKFQFIDPTKATNTTAYTKISVPRLLNGAQLLLKDTEFQGSFPIPIRTGDINQDGYPDLLLLIRQGDGHTRARILTSMPCTDDTCTAEQVQASRRSFQLLEHGADALDQLENVRSAAFFDFSDDGTLDILALSKSDTSNNRNNMANRQITTLQNNFFNDAFFLKTLVLNGVCAGHCPTDQGYPRERPYGVNYHGASFKYTVIDRKGHKHAKEVVQLPQSAYLSLQLPYSLFGLGRTNNYVEELFVGITRHQTEHYHVWAGVIPNSQLIVVPHQEANDHSSAGWTRELFVNPSAYIPNVLMALIGTSVVLALIVLFLDRREKREDQREKLSTSHVFNFDAL
ncbi:hypothetical protein BDF19DRAFT_437639 [Syncephalis fuscata]|nr:hypothetical protein BDF19DRAFT_437639 [Syncephalis fuscata]